jgi:hypothetical protein
MSRMLVAVLLTAGLIGTQALIFARAQVDEYAAARRGRSWFTGPVQERDLSFLSVAAHRSLSAMANDIPSDARVLLVSLSPFLAPYDFYLAPRALRILIEVDDQLAQRAIERYPQSANQARRYLQQIEERGQRLTSEHLRVALATCDWLIVFMGRVEELPLGPDAPQLVPVGRHEQAALFRVEHEQ